MRTVNLGHHTQKSSGYKSLACILVLISASLANLAVAGTSRYPDFQPDFDFTLSFRHSNIDFQSSAGEQDVSQDHISILVFSKINPHLQMGFISGSSNLNIGNNPAAAGINLSGYHAGLAMRSAFGANPIISFHANYAYQETSNETTTQAMTLSWYEWEAGVFGKIILGQHIELSAGLIHHEVDARQRTTGTINDTQNLKFKPDLQEQLGIAWVDSTGGRIDLTLQNGRYQQVEFGFTQTFR